MLHLNNFLVTYNYSNIMYNDYLATYARALGIMECEQAL